MLKLLVAVCFLSLPLSLPAWGQEYVAFVGTAAAANKDYITLFNGAGSGKVLTLNAVYMSPIPSSLLAVTLIPAIISGVSTAGTTCTSLGIIKTDSTAPAVPSQVTATSTCATDPAVVSDAGSCTVDSASGATNKCFERATLAGFVIREGEGIMLRNTALASIGVVAIAIVFSMRAA